MCSEETPTHHGGARHDHAFRCAWSLAPLCLPQCGECDRHVCRAELDGRSSCLSTSRSSTTTHPQCQFRRRSLIGFVRISLPQAQLGQREDGNPAHVAWAWIAQAAHTTIWPQCSRNHTSGMREWSAQHPAGSMLSPPWRSDAPHSWSGAWDPPACRCGPCSTEPTQTPAVPKQGPWPWETQRTARHACDEQDAVRCRFVGGQWQTHAQELWRQGHQHLQKIA